MRQIGAVEIGSGPDGVGAITRGVLSNGVAVTSGVRRGVLVCVGGDRAIELGLGRTRVVEGTTVKTSHQVVRIGDTRNRDALKRTDEIRRGDGRQGGLGARHFVNHRTRGHRLQGAPASLERPPVREARDLVAVEGDVTQVGVSDRQGEAAGRTLNLRTGRRRKH